MFVKEKEGRIDYRYTSLIKLRGSIPEVQPPGLLSPNQQQLFRDAYASGYRGEKYDNPEYDPVYHVGYEKGKVARQRAISQLIVNSEEN